MTKRECAIVTAYTGVAMLQGEDLEEFYGYVSDVIGHRVHPHEIGVYHDEIRDKSRKDFIELCRGAK